MLAFIGPSELTIAAVIGLLLFGGQLPEVMRQIGRVWFGFRRSLNDLKRETGLEDALRDIRRETGGMRDIAKDFQSDMNPFASSESRGPKAADEEAVDVEVETTRKSWSSPTDTVASGENLDPVEDNAEDATKKRDKTSGQVVDDLANDERND